MRQSHLLIATGLLWAAAHPSWPQAQVGLPFLDQKGYVVAFRQQEMKLVVELGENRLTTHATPEMELTATTKVVDSKGNPLELAALRPGLEVALTGERMGSRLVLKTIRVLTQITDTKAKVAGIFERLEGQVATIGGERAALGAGVRVVGTDEWKGMTFASFSDMMVGSYVELEGKRGSDGLLVAAKAETWPNAFTRVEADMRSQLAQGLTLPAASQLSGGRVQIGGQEYRLVRDLAIQAYVTRVGYKVIPSYVRDLAADDPAKVTYRFYVIEDKTFNASAYPDGSVFINTGLLAVLDNEAQLAAVLGHEIAHVTYEHGRQRFQTARRIDVGNRVAEKAGRLWERVKGKNPLDQSARVGDEEVTVREAMDFGAELFSNVYSRQKEEEADRVGLFYMYQAGYDPREAPKVWRHLVDLTATQTRIEEAKADVHTFLYSDHPAAKERLDNLNKEIAVNWYSVDLSNAVIGEESYRKAVKKGAKG